MATTCTLLVALSSSALDRRRSTRTASSMLSTIMLAEFTVGSGSTANWIQFTATGGKLHCCCNYGDHVSAVWFYANTRHLHIRDGQAFNSYGGSIASWRQERQPGHLLVPGQRWLAPRPVAGQLGGPRREL